MFRLEAVDLNDGGQAGVSGREGEKAPARVDDGGQRVEGTGGRRSPCNKKAR